MVSLKSQVFLYFISQIDLTENVFNLKGRVQKRENRSRTMQ